ncbi:hypothetical protein PCYB_032970, partial [Plasmodium cynomolgi strain B]
MVAKNAFSCEVAEFQKKEKSNVHKYSGKALALTLLLVLIGCSANVVRVFSPDFKNISKHSSKLYDLLFIKWPTFENAKNCGNGVEKKFSGKNMRILFVNTE